nr:hypothetical protein [uncultured Halomonas sp.]
MKLNRELLEQSWCRKLFDAFCTWEGLPWQAGNMTKRIDGYARFFARLDRSLSSGKAITQQSLFDLFGAEGLRRHYLVVNYLIGTLGIEWDCTKQENMIERRRIEAMLADTREQPWHLDLLAYEKWLAKRRNSKDEPLKPLTVRGHLRAAVCLLEAVDVATISALPDDAIIRCTRKHSGHTASLSTFNAFAWETQRIKLLSPAKVKKRRINEERRLAEPIKTLLSRLSASPTPQEAQALLFACISRLYQLQLKQVRFLRWKNLEWSGARLYLHLNSARYELLEPLPGAISKHLPAGDPSDYLFKGRSAAQPLSEAAMHYHLNKHQRSHSG